jgi:hypothetical protein
MLFKLDDKCEKYGENFIDAVRLSVDVTVRIFWKPVTKERHDVGSLFENFAKNRSKQWKLRIPIHFTFVFEV